MAFDINDRTSWAWKPISSTGVKPGDYLPNPTDRHSFYQFAPAGDGALRPVLHQCPIENANTGTQQVFNPELNVCDFNQNLESDASIYEYCLQQGWLERDER